MFGCQRVYIHIYNSQKDRKVIYRKIQNGILLLYLFVGVAKLMIWCFNRFKPKLVPVSMFFDPVEMGWSLKNDPHQSHRRPVKHELGQIEAMGIWWNGWLDSAIYHSFIFFRCTIVFHACIIFNGLVCVGKSSPETIDVPWFSHKKYGVFRWTCSQTQQSIDIFIIPAVSQWPKDFGQGMSKFSVSWSTRQVNI